MKDIKDYLHLYIGCECMVTWKLFMNRSDGRYPLDGWMLLMSHNATQSIKPFLRPLNDMTEEEKDDFADHGYELEDNGELPVNIWKGVNMSGHVLWLLSKSFDLFGLIEAGIAIDKTKLLA